jgi:pyruvate/2-oxoglutarate/acetoin dehydrogenase E1 component
VPLDRETIVESVKKTSKAMVVVEDHHSFGVGAELVATIAENAFNYLDAPLVRIAPPDTPIPYSPPLEDAYLPQTQGIAEAIKKLAEY